MAIINGFAAAAQRRRSMGQTDKLWEAANRMIIAVQSRSFTDHVGRLWEAAKDYWDILRPMRFCVFVWIGITLLITAVPQSQDALLALFENVFPGIPICYEPGITNCYDSVFDWLSDPKRVPPLGDSLSGAGHLIAFASGALLWAWQTFYWARFASRLPARFHRNQIYSPPILSNNRIKKLNIRIPRWLGRLVLASVWVALALANLQDPLRDTICAAIPAALFACRRRANRLFLFVAWVTLIVGVGVSVRLGETLNPLYELTLSLMMVVLFVIYRTIVRRRREFANEIVRRLHLIYKGRGKFANVLAPTLRSPTSRISVAISVISHPARTSNFLRQH